MLLYEYWTTIGPDEGYGLTCSGQNSNGSQFFILYKSAPHLDFKHTVFGSVVGGLDTLTKMERVPVDDDDRPRQVGSTSRACCSVIRLHVGVIPLAESMIPPMCASRRLMCGFGNECGIYRLLRKSPL